MIWSTDWFGSPCIDLRDADAFQTEHIIGSTSLAWIRLPSSMHELPDKHHPLKLVGTDEQLKLASGFLIEKGYTVEAVYALDEYFWQWARSEAITESGCNTVPLWQANPLLANHIDNIESLISGRKALDLACGAGRDAVFLAQRGWEVTAVDANKDSLARCESLAKSSNTNLSTQCIDLELQQPAMDNPAADLIVVMRYLHRPLLPWLAKWLNPGGIICYSTFMVGSEEFGSPRNPNYLLKPSELANTYSDMKIVYDEVHHLADGRPVAHFVAQKSA